MARLLRIHFASIGHRDARLAPLTLDLRDPKSGAAVDSILWLRNGGGKSSILNLFFSLFRPHRHEFLGSSAEAGDRKLEDYVEDDDLAFVLTEWATPAPSSQASLFASAPSRVVVGQMLGWRNHQRSSDSSQLRRLFFRFRVDDDVLSLDRLPIQGLGETRLTSFQDFRDFLDSAAQRHPELDLVRTETIQQWLRHLEDAGLDPELFRYQLKMNRREGAADEEFRFSTGAEFIDYLLELAFDDAQARQLAESLEKQREALRLRPGQELERSFLVEVLARLETLVARVEAERGAREALDGAVGTLARTKRRLERDAERVEGEVRRAQEEREAREEERRRAANERDKRQRWANGYERLAAQLDVQDAERSKRAADEAQAEAEGEVALLRAASSFVELRARRADVEALEASLDALLRELAPDRDALGRDGRTLVDAIDRSIRTLNEQAEAIDVAIAHADACQGEADTSARHASEALGAARREAREHKEWLEARDVARTKLIDEGALELRADASEALARVERTREAMRAERASAERALADDETRIDVVEDHLRADERELASLNERVSHDREALARAQSARDRLARHPRVLEAEGLPEGDDARPESEGLPGRLREAAAAVRSRALDARAAASDDDRALASLESERLLPATPSNRIVLEALRAKGVKAFDGGAYLAETASSRSAAQKYAADPARYGGVIVQSEADLAVARELAVTHALRAPVSIALVDGTTPPLDVARHTVLPHPAAYDRGEADGLRQELAFRREQRDRAERTLATLETEFHALADEVERFQRELGGGRLAALETQLRSLSERAERTSDAITTRRAELVELRASRARCRARITEASVKDAALVKVEAALAGYVERFERDVNRRRAALDAANRTADAAEDELRRAEETREEARSRRDAEVRRRIETRAQIDERTRARDHVRHVGPDEGHATEPVAFEVAKARYDYALDRYEQRLGDQRLQGRLDSARAELVRAESVHGAASVGLDPAAIELRADADRLPLAIARADEALRLAIRAVADAENRLRSAEEARRTLEGQRRRDADDLDSSVPRPETASEARAIASTHRAAAEAATLDVNAAEGRIATLEASQARMTERGNALSQALVRIRDAADTLAVALPRLEPEPDAEEGAFVDATSALESELEALRTAHKRHRTATGEVEAAVSNVRAVAHDERFAEIRHQFRERLREDSGAIAAHASDHRDQLAQRLVVLERKLVELEENRRVLLQELGKITETARRLVDRAARASEMPDTLEGWGGRPYLRIAHRLPDTDAERNALLGPFIDRIVQQAELPTGLALVQKGLRELAGARGFDVRILKPDAVLRSDAVPITEMSKFSRGQQLTAAILLYCTLVQLRARTRGRTLGPTDDSGPLLLDNPVGTCSNRALLELQRAVAGRMGVQLLYATGVEDLEAIATLPHTIRLRNAHRDRRTGRAHVTQEDARIDGMRLLAPERE